MSQTDLEDLMKDQAEVVQATVASFKAGELADRKQAEATIETARGVFVKCGLEYSARNFPLRATAFQGGYAPLIFRPAAWRLPKSGKKKDRPGVPKWYKDQQKKKKEQQEKDQQEKKGADK